MIFIHLVICLLPLQPPLNLTVFQLLREAVRHPKREPWQLGKIWRDGDSDEGEDEAMAANQVGVKQEGQGESSS